MEINSINLHKTKFFIANTLKDICAIELQKDDNKLKYENIYSLLTTYTGKENIEICNTINELIFSKFNVNIDIKFAIENDILTEKILCCIFNKLIDESPRIPTNYDYTIVHKMIMDEHKNINFNDAQYKVIHIVHYLCSFTMFKKTLDKKNTKKYSNKIIYIFLNILIQKYNLTEEAKNSSPIDYLKQTYSKIYNSNNVDWIDDSLYHFCLPRYFNDVLHTYSFFKKNSVNNDIQNDFFRVLYELYMDRCDINYKYKIELEHSYESLNLDIYNQMYNTVYEINLMSFFEDDGTVDYKKRNDLKLLKRSI